MIETNSPEKQFINSAMFSIDLFVCYLFLRSCLFLLLLVLKLGVPVFQVLCSNNGIIVSLALIYSPWNSLIVSKIGGESEY